MLPERVLLSDNTKELFLWLQKYVVSTQKMTETAAKVYFPDEGPI